MREGNSLYSADKSNSDSLGIQFGKIVINLYAFDNIFKGGSITDIILSTGHAVA
jgi:hypothetical protein